MKERLRQFKELLMYFYLLHGRLEKINFLLYALFSLLPRRIKSLPILLKIQYNLLPFISFKITQCRKLKNNKSKVRIGWVADHFYPDYLGGAEITDFLMIKAGVKKGYEIIKLDRDSVSDLRNLLDLDFLVVSNVHTFRPKEILNILLQRYVLYLHDTTVDNNILMLMKNAELVIFLSPLHRKFFEKRFRLTSRVLIIPPPIEVHKYYQSEKEEFAIYAGLIAKHKGIYNIIRYARQNPSLKIILVGRKIERDLSFPANVEYLGEIPQHRLIDLLSRAKYFIHLPEWVEAFGRAVAEAYLCGCKLITNEKVGFLSYPWNFQDKEAVRRELCAAETRFWNVVTSILGFNRKSLH